MNHENQGLEGLKDGVATYGHTTGTLLGLAGVGVLYLSEQGATVAGLDVLGEIGVVVLLVAGALWLKGNQWSIVRDCHGCGVTHTENHRYCPQCGAQQTVEKHEPCPECNPAGGPAAASTPEVADG